MTKASEKALGDLHAAVAQTLTQVITISEPVEGEPAVAPSAAYLAVAVSFLKNNSITADPEKNEDLRELEEQLNANRKAGKQKLSGKHIEDAVKQLERDIAPGMFD